MTEWHFETEGKASLVLFGVLDGEEVKYAIKIPYALSILAHFNPNAEVIGLDQFEEEDLPPLYIHYLFDIMVSIGMFIFASFITLCCRESTGLAVYSFTMV